MKMVREIGKTWVAAFGISAAASSIVAYSSDAAAFWKRGSAVGCHAGSLKLSSGALSVGDSEGRPFTVEAQCAYPDDENLPHESVTNLNVHGRGPVTFQACTKDWNGTFVDCTPSKESNAAAGTVYGITFSETDLASSWTQSNRANDFAYLRVLMVTGSKGEFSGWFTF